MKSSPRVAVIGGGPAGLMAATVLSKAGAAVTIYEQMPTVGRKFLLAGRGGLNLTHSEPLAGFVQRYRAARPALDRIIEAFSPTDLIRFAEELGQETFIGSSGRVFPKAFKASPMLRAWLRRLREQGVDIRTRSQWTGFQGATPIIRDASGVDAPVAADCTILALGGASWPKLGSNGTWGPILQSAGVEVAPFLPANNGFLVTWSEHVSRFAGEPLKRIALEFDGETVRGEAMLTANGIEGGAVYALSAPLRDAILRNGFAPLRIDFRPDLSWESLEQTLAKHGPSQSMTTRLRKAVGLSPAAIAVLRESTANALPANPAGLARAIKGAVIRLAGVPPIERAISSAGGVSFAATDERLMLKNVPGVFVAGEMLDWEAPTGGYLLQASFATGVAAAKGALNWWDSRD